METKIFITVGIFFFFLVVTLYIAGKFNHPCYCYLQEEDAERLRNLSSEELKKTLLNAKEKNEELRNCLDIFSPLRELKKYELTKEVISFCKIELNKRKLQRMMDKNAA